MKRIITTLATALVVGLFLGSPAQATGGATTPTGPTYTNCANLSGWYANPDEQDQLPQPTEAGLKFEGKNLIHHSTSPIDLADMDKVTHSFTASTSGKVVFKVETSAPYSTIVTNADGKIWSTAMSYDQEGGQGHPIDKYSDLVGKPTKPGKAPYTSASAVVTFGVGYWVEEGSTVVSSISFHGHTYSLTCAPKPVPSPTKVTPSASTSVKPSASASIKPRATSSTAAVIVSNGTGLPVTGAPVGLIVGGAVSLLVLGAGLYFIGRRRKVDFTA